MNLAEQALFLLDIQPSTKNRKSLDNFANLDQMILASFPGESAPAEPVKNEPTAEKKPFSVASRMSRVNYEDQARAEALTQALKHFRAKNGSRSSSSRVIRQS
jgi:hypothetical protein